MTVTQINLAQQRIVLATPFAATITPAVPAGEAVYAVAALTGAVTIANPTGTPYDGQTIEFRLAQDATGSRVITFGTAYTFGTDVTAAMIPSAASSKWRMVFEYNAALTKWQAISIVRGF